MTCGKYNIVGSILISIQENYTSTFVLFFLAGSNYTQVLTYFKCYYFSNNNNSTRAMPMTKSISTSHLKLFNHLSSKFILRQAYINSSRYSKLHFQFSSTVYLLLPKTFEDMNTEYT